MISVIIPVVRPDKAQRCIEAVRKHSGGVVHEIVVEEDTDRLGCPRMVKRLTDRAFFDWVMFLGDDTVPQEGFMAEAVKHIAEFPDEWGMVGLNDCHWNGNVVATIDKQGRVTLDARLREHAGLAAQAAVVVLGNIDQIEIWEPEAYRTNEAAGQHEIASGR